MYDNPHQYLLHIARLFHALGSSSFEAGAAERTSDGLGVALWLPPGVHGKDGPLEAAIAESIVGEKQTEVAAIFKRTEHYRPIEPHWYLSLIGVEALHRNNGCGAALLQHRLRQCDREPLASIPLVIEPVKYHSLREAWLSGRGRDPNGFVALHLSHAAQCALNDRHAQGRMITS